jgi:phage recombination protein Bet
MAPTTEQRRPGPGPSRISQKLTGRLAEKYGVPPEALLSCLRDTAFKPAKNEPPFSDIELAAALIIAEQYDLNPWAKEIYVTRSHGKLLVIVPIDGWTKIVNRDPQYDGCEFATTLNEDGSLYSITCRMYRKDRSRPVEVTEYLAECKRDTEPWAKWPFRMTRHKAFIQAARYAFALSGIMDDDEAEGMIEREAERPVISGRRRPAALPAPQVSGYDFSRSRQPEEVYQEQGLEAELAAAETIPAPGETMQVHHETAGEPIVKDFLPPQPSPAAEPAPAPATGGVFDPRTGSAAPRQATVPGTTPPAPALWAKWTRNRAGLTAENLAQIKRQIGVESITQATPPEKLDEACILAGEITGR